MRARTALQTATSSFGLFQINLSVYNKAMVKNAKD
jgi:hypothetical protein